jgi:hypothetical protein
MLRLHYFEFNHHRLKVIFVREIINTVPLCMLIGTKFMRFEVLAAVSMKTDKFLPGYVASHIRSYYSFENYCMMVLFSVWYNRNKFLHQEYSN